MSTARNNFSYLTDQIYQLSIFSRKSRIVNNAEKELNFFDKGFKKLEYHRNLQANDFEGKLSGNIPSWEVSQNQRDSPEEESKLDLFKSSFRICA